MAYEIRDGRGGVRHTSDAGEALDNLMGSGSTAGFGNPLTGMLCDMGRGLIDSLSNGREMREMREAERTEAYENVHRAALAALDLIATEDGGSLRVGIKPVDAVDSFLRLSGALGRGVDAGVVVNHAPTQRLIETLNDAVGDILGFPASGGMVLEDFDITKALESCSSRNVHDTCRRVLDELKPWFESDPLVQTLSMTL